MIPEKILFIQTAFIGDAILTLPAIQQLHKIFPDCLVDVLCIPESREIYESSPFVNDSIVLDKKGSHRSLFGTIKLARELRERDYSRLYSAHRSFRTALFVMNAGINESFGFDNSSLKHIYKNIVRYDSEKHEVQRNLDLIGYSYDDNNWRIIPDIRIERESKYKVQKFIDQWGLGPGFIALAPGSIWETKKYPVKFYIEIIDDLIEKKHSVVLIGGEKDKELCSGIKVNFESVVDSSGELSVAESIELLRSAGLLISNDSAPTHMGMCAGIKVLTIFCSTVPGFGFFPYNSGSKFISFDELDCKPCGIHGHKKCPVNTFECAERIRPAEIIKMTEKMLSENR